MTLHALDRLRAEAPLILNITNYVVMNTTANALLAVGASPVMAHATDEIEDLTALAGALVINIGTLSKPWIDAMFLAGRKARERGIPVVIDPVGSGATGFRTDTSLALIRELRPAVIRGNASEIRSLVQAGGPSKGVDSVHQPDEVLGDAQRLSASSGSVVVISGPVDLVVFGDQVARIANGHPMMTRVTGMGCTATALIGAYLAVSESPFQAARDAMSVMGICGERAAEKSAGPGSLQMNFLDTLYGLTAGDIVQQLRLTQSPL
jgi:hydroxyethylthiazole kinase